MTLPELLMPVPGGVKTGGFGDWYTDSQGRRYQHRGFDIGGVPAGSPIVAPCDGTLVPFTNNGDFGPYALCIDYEGRGEWFILLAHGRAAYVGVGDVVSMGQPIGEVGDLGLARGVHCHVQVCRDTRFSTAIGDSIDPEPLFTVTEDDMRAIEDLARRVETLELAMASGGEESGETRGQRVTNAAYRLAQVANLEPLPSPPYSEGSLRPSLFELAYQLKDRLDAVSHRTLPGLAADQ